MKKPLSPLPASSWTVQTARHLMNRAGFGEGSVPVSSRELSRMSPSRAVSGFVDFEDMSDQVDEPDFLPGKLDFYSYRKKLKEKHPNDKDLREEKYKKYKKDHRKAVRQLKTWWLKRMHRTKRPLEEKLALFWHGHFATEAREVKNANWNYQLNKVFRSNAAGNIKVMTFEVAKSPAMLRYLDNDKNKKKHPNENWSRELMELHTLGLGHFSERDVLESARAFTGWTIEDGEFSFNKSWHDRGTKEFLGHSGDFNGGDIIRILFEKGAVSLYFSLKILQHFAERKPDPEIVRAFAEVLRDENYHLKPMLETLFRSRYFYSDSVMGSKVKSPVQFVLGLLNDLQLEPEDVDYRFLRNVLSNLGQDLFDPPNVKGWDGNRDWINTSTLLHRYNLAEDLVFGRKIDGLSPEQLFSQSDPNTAGDVISTLTDRFFVTSIDKDQTSALLDLLERSKTDKFSPDEHSNKKLKKLITTLLSSPEYQLC